tara:strand:+ start:149 stop:706 length:558 start_codon:yes stop_codon:yes gene_type:complete
MAEASDFLSGPIPGQSLTTTPSNYPWEKPPEMVDVEDVVKYYINKLANQDVMDDLSVMFEADMAVSSFVKSLMTSGTMFGKHTLDAGTLAAPAVHAFIKAAMTQYGIKVRDEPYDPDKDPTVKEQRRLELRIKLAMSEADAKGKTAENDPGVALLEELQQAQTQEETQEEAQPEEGGMGLMSKGA